ncbi:MAG: glycosyltransferase, partial [Methylobacterium sp.]
FNHGRFIVERIRSVQNQVIPPDEIIFLDDASTDDSLALARATLEDGAIPFQIIANEQNSGGVFRQWMRGIDAARHELIWVAETDDSAHPEFLMHLLPSFRREDVRAAFGHITGIDPEGAPLPDLNGYLDGLHDFAWDRSAVVPARRAFAWDFAVKNIIPNASGLVFRKFALTEAERARLFEYRFAGDWYFYALMLRGGSLAFCRHARSFFRVNRDSASRSVFFTDRHLQEHRMVLQDIHAEYGVSAAALTAHVEALATILTDRSGAELGRLLAPEPVRRRRLRLCIAANGFAVGGGELLPLELANALKHLGHHVTYLVVERGAPGAGLRDRLNPDIPVLCWDDVAAAIPAFLADFGIEVFNSHNVSVDYRLTLLHQPFPVPYVGSLHGGYETVPELLTPELFRFLRETVDSWLYLSAKNIQPLLRLGVAPATLHHSFNAIAAFTGEWVDRTAFRATHG